MVKYVYDAWGNQLVQNADGTECESGIGVLNPFRYRGYYYDEESKLYYLQTRYYDPKVGRFLNIDSLDYADPETINGLNLFTYCGNNPVMNVDPEGTWSWKGFGMIMAAIAIVAVVAVATAVTAGAAAAAIAGAAGFTTLGVEAVGVTVATAALAGGLAAGTGEIVNQVADKGAENINLGSVAISTASTAIDSALTAGALFTGPTGTAALWGSRVLVAGISSIGYGLNEGYSAPELAMSFSASVGITATLGQFMSSSKALTMVSVVLAPVKAFGTKLGASIILNFGKHVLLPLLD